jgi:hypothetical protein
MSVTNTNKQYGEKKRKKKDKHNEYLALTNNQPAHQQNTC